MTTASITCAGCRHTYAETALFCPNCGRPRQREAAADPLLGKLLGDRFQILELIGQGGSGTIYRAEHVTLRRKVAIKVLHTELSRDDLAVERFRREATTVAEIDNEHIVEIHDFGRTQDGRLYLAMELLEGETLDAVLQRENTLSVERVADILIQLGEAMMEAHAIGYVHRDLRPRNIYLAVRRGKANFVKLLDFGLAKLVESDASAASTSLGMTFGDPRYMSPEQARGDRIDRRADIYQLGCIAYEMLTGAPPFTGNRVFDILTKQVTEIPAPLPTRRPGVPLWMEASVAKMLAKDPENRFATTTRMVEALRRGLETGQVMEDEIARRRESIPPPSVSRVMQRMGMSQPAETPREHMPQRELPPLPPAPKPPAQTVHGYGSDAPAAAAAPEPAPVSPTITGMPPVAEPRRRTGTPDMGVPAVAVQAPVAGQIEPPPRVMDPVGVAPGAAPMGRAKTPTRDPMGISQAWYEDGDRASAEADSVRARKVISPSTTDMSLYEETLPPRRRWPLFAGVSAVVLVMGGTIVFALTRGGDSKSTTTPPPAPVAANATTGPAIDAAPSVVIGEPVGSAASAGSGAGTGTGSASADVVAAKDTRPAKTEPVVHEVKPEVKPERAGRERARATTTAADDDASRRRPHGLDDAPPAPPPPPKTTVVIKPGNTTSNGKSGVSGAEGPQDPYGAGDTTNPGDDAAPEKKAEFYANLGGQQLASGDNAGAAASFKKATELDPKNVNAVTGMGEIALRQGLFGDAVAHLKKAARMAPKSSRIFTLLGEAYLNSGQNAVAADNFKKALQLDPDNARARDGYNEASSRVPPPSDE
jgi:serine/threonine protein kinase